ncbi:hypothetical protein PF010_g21295 [Phytophthora fragariae]|uniref:Uncharacterized protein n=1 Tax=Phytophthora fragariae TaxID=53985 RepID=A0A6G0KBQ4_9STRA|nr:hypothetical protein PF010_g21295 [Phytophthora fragariae]KAE9197200.1 hypothetical protein PF004_g19896 [Phytophthora fragariae]
MYWLAFRSGDSISGCSVSWLRVLLVLVFICSRSGGWRCGGQWRRRWRGVVARLRSMHRVCVCGSE